MGQANSFEAIKMTVQHVFYVISPELTTQYSYMEPPETYRSVVVVEAQNEYWAKVKAIKHPDFQDWVDEARGDHRNPFTGVIAEWVHCIHGECLCHTDPRGDEDPLYVDGCDRCYILENRLEQARRACNYHGRYDSMLVNWSNNYREVDDAHGIYI